MSGRTTRRLAALLIALFSSAIALGGTDNAILYAVPGATANPPTGLADSAALRATVFGTPPQNIAPLPQTVPLTEIDLKLPWERPVPNVFWFNKRLRVWFSAQKNPAPLAIVISGTGSDGNTSNISILRAALYGAGYHVLTLPSPTFPNFIVSASTTGVAGDLLQDSRDLYASIQVILARLPKRIRITDIDILGYSLGGANAGVVKSIADAQGPLKIHRALMINPPVSLFDSMRRLDRLFTVSIGSSDSGFDDLYRRLYARLANLYRASGSVHVDEADFLTAASAVLKTDADFTSAIALIFRIDLVNVFFAGDLYAGTGVVVDPRHPPNVGDSLESVAQTLRGKPFSEYFSKVLLPYYSARRPGTTAQSLTADSNLSVIANALHTDPDYYALTNSDDLILDKAELSWLQTTMGPRIVTYDHGGHLGNLGERQQIADMLAMLSGQWPDNRH